MRITEVHSLTAFLCLILAGSSTGCAESSEGSEELEADIAALETIPRAKDPSTQRMECDGNDMGGTTVGPFGTCKEVMLSRTFLGVTKDANGKVLKPAAWKTPARWQASLSLPLGLPTSQVSRVRMDCRESKDSILRSPLWGVTVTYTVGTRADFGLGMLLVPGENHCSMQLMRRGATEFDPKLKYDFVLRATKKSGEVLPVE